MPEVKHTKLLIRHSLLGGAYYADSYTFFAGEAPPTPMVVYIGGSISDEVFDERSRTKPATVFESFLRAMGESGGTPAELLVCPFPPPRLTPLGEDGHMPEAEGTDGVALLSESDWRTVLRRRFLSMFVTEVLPACNLPLPTDLGLVGFSSGAYLAVGLALDLSRSRAVATLGGTGMAEAVKQSPREACRSKRFAAYANDEDPMKPNVRQFEAFMRGKGVKVSTLIRAGRHSFADYARNGLAEEAFGFVMKT